MTVDDIEERPLVVGDIRQSLRFLALGLVSSGIIILIEVCRLHGGKRSPSDHQVPEENSEIHV